MPELGDAFPVRSEEELFARFMSIWDALELGELDEFADLAGEWTHPDCAFRSGIGTAVGGGAYVGLEGIRGWFADVVDTTSERRWRNRSLEIVGHSLLYLADFDFTGVASGARVTSEVAAIFEFEDGLCVKITSFTSHEEGRRFAEAAVA